MAKVKLGHTVVSNCIRFFTNVGQRAYNNIYHIHMYYSPNLLCCHFTQHIVFGITAILAWIIPDVPKEVDNQVKRENFLAREALRSADQYDTGSPAPEEDSHGQDDFL